MEKIFITCEDLKKEINNEKLLIFDCRGDNNDIEKGFEEYQNGHIPKAIFLDGETVLCKEKSEHGGRHPVIDMDMFSKYMKNFGLNDESYVVAYGLWAPRLLFLLNNIGFENVKILDGGFDEWDYLEYDIQKDINKPAKIGNFIPKLKNLIVDKDYVLKNLDNDDVLIVDSRDEIRYRGIEEPIDPIAGRIPFSVNYPYIINYDEYGLLLDKSILIKNIEALGNTDDKEIVLYCGSGVTACYNYTVLKSFDIDSRIYMGSWSDWISYNNIPYQSDDI